MPDRTFETVADGWKRIGAKLAPAGTTDLARTAGALAMETSFYAGVKWLLNRLLDTSEEVDQKQGAEYLARLFDETTAHKATLEQRTREIAAAAFTAKGRK